MRTMRTPLFLGMMAMLCLAPPGYGQIWQNTPFDPKTWEETFDNTPFDPDTWKDTIKNTPMDPDTWQDTIQDIRDPAGAACQGYMNHFRRYNQSNRSESGLTHTQKFYLRPWFGDLVDRVRVMYHVELNKHLDVPGVKTLAVAAGAQTMGYNIYFQEGPQDSAETRHLIDLAHEMTHVWQFEKKGRSLDNFCRSYMSGWLGSGGNYFDNPMERAAYDFEIKFAQWLAKTYPHPPNFIYRTPSPNQRRTVEVPDRLWIPPQEYALAAVVNPTNLTITYGYKWEEGEWKYKKLEPNRKTLHWHKYPGGLRSSPELQIVFDQDLSGNRRNIYYTLERFRSTEKSYKDAKTYEFQVHNNELDLRRVSR